MNDRISTSMMYSQSTFLMMSKQAKLSHLEQQLALGQRLVSAKDNPVAAGTGVGLDRALAQLDRLGQNANTIENRLGLQENALSQAGEMLARVNDLTIRANSPSLSSDDKKSIASELKSIKDSLLSLANSTDGTGRYLFGGTTDDTAPFSVIDGKVVYSGDQTQRHTEIAPEMFAKDTLPGSEIFMRIRTGDGTVDGNAAIGNSGTVVLTTIGRDGASQWNGGQYTLRFTSASEYEVLDKDGNDVLDANGDKLIGTYTKGEDLVFQGLRVRLEGVPEVGDSFEFSDAGSRDVFSSIDRLIGALTLDTATTTGKTGQQNLLQSSLRDIARASEKMIDSRAAGGAQLATIDSAASLREATTVTLKSTLSGMRDLDYADAISQYKLEQVALQAAQTIFTQMQSMSLFNMIR